MPHRPGRSVRKWLVLVVGIVVSGCATGVPEVQPVDIPRLQQAVAASPDDTDLQVQLGMAQFKAGEYEQASQTLGQAVEGGNESGAAFLYLGMAEEELEDWTAARSAYGRYLDLAESGPTREEVRERLTLIGRNLLRAQAQQALAQEQEITATEQIAPRSVAVLPLAFNSEREDLEPLIYALSDMMITDFKVSNALVVLERARIQTLLDEMALTSAGYADAQTGARAGRLLRAEHVFQGVLTTLGGDELQTDADVLNVPNTSSAGQLTEAAQLERLFDMEKQIVIRTIREVLGVELTPAEEQAILDNRMSNVMAFLAYGRGLRQLDLGNYEAAQAEFETMMALEGGAWEGAASAMAEAAALIDASSTSTADLSDLAATTGETGSTLFGPPPLSTTAGLSDMGLGDADPVGAGATEEGDAGATTTVGSTGTLTNVTEGVNPTATSTTLDLGAAGLAGNPTPEQSQPTDRDPIQEALGQESISSTTEALIRIIIQRPGGEE